MLRRQLSLSDLDVPVSAHPRRRPVAFPTKTLPTLSWGMGQLSALERSLSSESFGIGSENLSQSPLNSSPHHDTVQALSTQMTDDEIVDDEMQKWVSESISDAEMNQVDLLKFWKASKLFSHHF